MKFLDLGCSDFGILIEEVGVKDFTLDVAP